MIKNITEFYNIINTHFLRKFFNANKPKKISKLTRTKWIFSADNNLGVKFLCCIPKKKIMLA